MKRTPLSRSTPLEPGLPPQRRTGLRSVSGRMTEDRNTASRTGNFPAAGRAVPARKKNAARKKAAAGAATGQRKPPGEFTPRVKRLVRRRAGQGDVFLAACEGCWRHLGEDDGQFQHRVARGSGGCRDEVVNGPANCLLLCRGCHSEAEERRRDLSQDGAGFWIEHGTGPGYDPRCVAVMLGALGSSGVTVHLAADGTYTDEAPEGTEAA